MMQTKVEMVMTKIMVFSFRFSVSSSSLSAESFARSSLLKTENRPSNFYPQNLPNHEHTRDLERDCDGHEFVAARVVPEDAHVVGVHEGDGERDEERQAAENPRRHSRRGRQRPQVFENAEALADGVGDLLKNFGEVSARLALNHDRRDAEPQVEERYARGEVFERELERESEV